MTFSRSLRLNTSQEALVALAINRADEEYGRPFEEALKQLHRAAPDEAWQRMIEKAGNLAACWALAATRAGVEVRGKFADD